MSCPMWIDYTRECGFKSGLKISFLPENTLDFCVTDKYVECPFYRTLNNIGFHCEYLEKCPAYQHFAINDFVKFSEIAKNWCLSKDNIDNCERRKLRKSDKEPPSNMLPDGSSIEQK